METPVSVDGSYLGISSVYDRIYVRSGGHINIFVGKDSWYIFGDDVIEGNGLQVSVNDQAGKVTGEGFDLVPSAVNFTPPLGQNNHISFYEDKVLVQDKNNLLYYKCTMGDLVTYNCSLSKTVTLDPT